MGRINLKSEKSFERKYVTDMVSIPYLSDCFEVRLHCSGKVLFRGSKVAASSFRFDYEYFRREPVQLELF